MKPKEWLKANGHITEITRGRLSKENISRIENAVRNGAVIEGYSVSTKIEKNDSQSTGEPAEPTVSRVSVQSDAVADVPDERRPERNWEAHTYVDGKRQPVGMRTVCNTCGSSLNYCGCRTPMVWTDSENQGMVSFMTRKTALPVRPWG